MVMVVATRVVHLTLREGHALQFTGLVNDMVAVNIRGINTNPNVQTCKKKENE